MKDTARVAESTVQRAEELEAARKATPRKRRKKATDGNGPITVAQVHPKVMKVAKALPGVREGWRVIRPIDARTVMVENRTQGGG